MKRFLAIVMAAMLCVSALCVSASALDLNKKDLLVQVWAQDTATWSWKSGSNTGTVNLGETVELTFTDGAVWADLDTSASINMGLQVLDETLTANGETASIKYEISDLVIKAKGYDDLVVKVAGTYDVSHTTAKPDWATDDSTVAGASDDYNFSPADIGITNTADYTAWFNAIESMTIKVTYLAYNGEGVPVAQPDDVPTEPADDTTSTPDTAEPAPDTAEPSVPETKEPANTGIVFAVLPMAVAAVAVVFSKKR